VSRETEWVFPKPIDNMEIALLEAELDKYKRQTRELEIEASDYSRNAAKRIAELEAKLSEINHLNKNKLE